MKLEEAAKYINEKGDQAQKSLFVKYLSNMEDNDEIEKTLFKSGIDKSVVNNDPWGSLVCFLKSESRTFRVIHHHIISPNWDEDHEYMGDVYAKFDELEDWAVEVGMALGEQEPSDDMAFEIFPVAELKNYDFKDAYKMVMDSYLEAVSLMEKAKEGKPDHLVSEIESKQYDLWFIAQYKLAQRVKAY
jgi:hypothetical protein